MIAAALSLAAFVSVQAAQQTQADSLPTLGLEQGVERYTTASFDLELVRASQTVAALRPNGAGGFDFTPGDWLERRSANGYFHLGDVTLRLRRGGSDAWQDFSTAAQRQGQVYKAEGRFEKQIQILGQTLAQQLAQPPS